MTVTTFVNTMAADLVVRPAGNIILIFGFRDAAKAVDDFGLKMIQKGLDVNFF